jgi:integrase
MHSDGGGLYLQITKAGAKTWIFRYTRNERTRDMGLGSLQAVSLGDARSKAGDCRGLLASGIDPIDHRDAERQAELQAAALEAALAIPFKECAEQYIAGHKKSWSNPKHRQQWENTLKTYAYPVIGDLAARYVTTSHIVSILEPIWESKTETASRLRGRIESVLDWTKVRGYREGENPARWRGHLDQILPKPSKVQAVRHHPALKVDDIGRFVAALGRREGGSAHALEFLILTVARTCEVTRLPPSEIDVAKKVWIVPAGRMKNRKEHRVPLSDRAVEIVKEEMKAHPDSKYIFPGAEKNSALSDMAMEMLIRRMNGKSDPPTWRDVKGEAVVPHGCRSTFRDWASERTGYSKEAIEISLAHRTDDETEAAYFRSDLFEKRRRLLRDWAKFCAMPIDDIQRDNVLGTRSA